MSSNEREDKQPWARESAGLSESGYEMPEEIKESIKKSFQHATQAASNFFHHAAPSSGNYTSSQPSHVDASIDKTIGDVRSTIGEALGAESVQAAGEAQAARGDAQDTMARLRENLEHTADQMQGRDPALGQRPNPWRAE
ncbi:hypothetical protein DACRYDRAFT_20571 [Dacryopinax primogenitus]|uniref:CsbD-like domain-containing protein n=1 Tax=Dacryopinax primogenitus (strain DJM 731) TaxID=1858805 RepID=M5G426_DACPD|nr:uncharacterized protein DACRYDRAFT_20571 [Dacryopinax primogenitus]EJU05016.1 hypothetical protein DACRYDRAFT_20571 [Dacryopinax primogenitus]